MKRSFRRAVPVLSALAPALVAFAMPAGAQQPQAAAAAAQTCDVDQNKPGSLAAAVFTITRMQASTDTAARAKSMREIVGKVSGDAKAAKENPIGTAFTLAQAYAILAQDVRLANNATAADVGLTGTGQVDLLKLVDSTTKVVQTAKPGCAESLTGLRQLAWRNVINASLTQLNEQKLDSAKYYADRATIVMPDSPFSSYVLGTVALTNKDFKGAEGHYAKTLQLIGTDTTMKDISAAATQNLAAARSAAAADIAKSGDYSALLAEPSKFGDLALTQAGVNASVAKKYDDAAKLFTAALEQNKFQRDALNNLAATQMQLKQYEPMVPIAQRLLEVDPANPDNYLFLAIAYQGVANASKTPAQKKALTDSLLKYNRLANEMPVKVTFTEFSRGDAKASLAMSVENLAKTAAAPARTGTRPAAGARPAAAAAAAGPKTFPIKIEFLDQAGNVVDTQDVSVGPVAPGATSQAKVEAAKPGIVAFRYKVQS
jgi:tetratricopeptide (TPR) repeat protein